MRKPARAAAAEARKRRQYVVAFDGGRLGRDRFDLLYGGFIAGGNTQERKSMEAMRREIGVLDAFAAIADQPVDVPDDLDGARVLRPGVQRLVLDQPQYELLLAYLRAVSWKTNIVRRAVALIDDIAALRPEDEERSLDGSD